MKKAFSAVLCLLLCCLLPLGAFGLNAAEPGDGVEVSTVVPGTHEITITYNEGGKILYDGQVLASGTTITVDRFEDVTLNILCNPDSHLLDVAVNGESAMESVRYGQLVLAGVHTDTDVLFTFQKCEDAKPLEPDDPGYDPDDPDKGADECVHIAMSGNVFRGEDAFPRAVLEFDLGAFTAAADKDGKYAVADIKDGFHTVTIYEADGKTVAGTANFSVTVSETAAEVTVDTLPDGTRLVTVPAGVESILLDFVVNLDENGEPDGTVTIQPGVAPEPEEPVVTPPTIVQTGALMREYPVLAAAAMTLVFVGIPLFFILLYRRKKDDEDEEPAS